MFLTALFLQDGKIIKFVQLIAFKFYSKKSKTKPLFTEQSIYSVINRPRHLPTQTRRVASPEGRYCQNKTAVLRQLRHHDF